MSFRIRFCLLLALGLFLPLTHAQAQFTFTNLLTTTKVKSCDDYATRELNNPWDMSDTADINNFFPDRDIRNLTAMSFGSGLFNATAVSAGASFYLLSPIACGSYPTGGRYGQEFPIDTAKYTHLSVRMNTDQNDSFGIRTIWDRDCDYATQRTATSPGADAIRPGWNTYTVNLNTIGLDTDPNASSNLNPWSAGSINGFAILPTTVSGANLSFDSIRLEDPTSCGSLNVAYSATASMNNGYYNLWIDTDTNPFNGFVKQFATAVTAAGADSKTFETLGVAPGNYYALGMLASDYRLLEASDPWDFSQSSDILTTTSIISDSIQGGSYFGTNSTSAPTIYLKVGDAGFSAAKYSKLTIKFAAPVTGNMSIFWNVGLGGSGSHIATMAEDKGGGLYQIDLNTVGGWSGTISNFAIRPGTSSGISFELQYVSLRGSGFISDETSLTSPTIVASTGFINVNQPPLIDIVHPSNKGGEALRAWNMNDGDLQLFSNLQGSADPVYTAENLTAYLPDVREFDGLRGDFFKGTNSEGSFDPVNFSLYEFSDNPITFEASEYKNLCFKLNLETDFSIGGGSVARVLWSSTSETALNTSEDLLLTYDGWSGTRWYEYCVDMTLLHLEATTVSNWSGTIKNFRVDPHEFTPATRYYFDYIKLRKNDTSKGVYNIAVDFSDADDAASVDIKYTDGSVASGGLLITTLSESQPSYAWDTSGIPAGSYLIYAEATDGMNQNKRVAKGRIVISNSGISAVAPELALQSPYDGLPICTSMQVKGYALQTDRFEDVSSVEVYADSTANLLGVIRPSLYSTAAVAAFPNADSSNSGFDKSVDVSALSTGAHTIIIKAISSDGTATSKSIAVTKQTTGCPAAIVDASPAGVPVVIPNVEKPETVAPTIKKLSQSADGTITLGIGQVGDATCNLYVYTGESSSSITNLVKAFTVTNSIANKNSVSVQAKKSSINSKKLKTVFFKVGKVCPAFRDSESKGKKLKIVTSKGSATLSALNSALSKKFKVASSSSKKKKRRR